jgi:hypothetical protein
VIRKRAGAALALIAASSLAVLPAGPLLAQDPQSQAASSEAVSGFESAGNLLRKCRENSSFARSYCYAYLAAVADAARSYRVWIGSGDPCLPAGLTMGKLADSFEAYLIANPSLTKAQAASVIVAGLQEAFPCPVIAANSSLPGVVSGQQGAAQKVDAAPQQDGQP